MFKNTSLWTLITTILTVLVYVELLVTGNMFIVLFAGAAAIISSIVAVVEKKYIYIVINVLLFVLAFASYIILY